MNFGDLRSIIHRGELPPLFATLPEEQHGYAMRMAGSKITARQERLRLAEWLVYAEKPLLSRDTREKIDPALDPLLRWYACDVASESMRMHGNGDARRLNVIEVSRKYVLGEVGREELKAAHQAARATASYAADVADDAALAADDAAVYAAYFAAHAAADTADVAAADADADAALWFTTYRKHRTLLIDWLRAYLMRWIEEGNWWEVPS